MRAVTPPDLAPPFARYAHGVEWPAHHRMLCCSGQLGLTADGDIPDAAEVQAGICFSNITAILAAADMTAQDIVHVTAYVTDRAHMAGYMAARDAYFADRPDDRLPASTLLIVSGFTRPEFKVEIEVLAAAP